jgi:peptidoglycan/LPS O-acetylase OafA/YrhL
LRLLRDRYDRHIRERIEGLDGLRAIAVTGVFLFHEDVPGMQLGWAGVELFYVISGFLITRILLRSREGPGYLRTFYLRRGLRILPIYCLAVIGALGIAAASGLLSSVLGFVPFYLGYAQNYYPQMVSGFKAGIPYLSHTWTLAIEEQFYWFWPLALLLFRGRRLLVLVALLFVSAPFVRLLLLQWTGNPFAVFATLPSQADGLAAGAALAIAIHLGISDSLLRRLGVVAALVGAAATSALVVRSGLDPFAVATSWAAEPLNALLLSSLALFFGGVVALTITSSGALVRALSVSPLRWSGRISYGLYLYDPFAILAVQLVVRLAGLDTVSGPGRIFSAAAHLAVVYAFALVSWRYIEEPLIRLKTRLAPERWRADARIAEPAAVPVATRDAGRMIVV